MILRSTTVAVALLDVVEYALIADSCHLIFLFRMSLACEIKFPTAHSVVLPVPCQLYAKEFDLSLPGTYCV